MKILPERVIRHHCIELTIQDILDALQGHESNPPSEFGWEKASLTVLEGGSPIERTQDEHTKIRIKWETVVDG